MKTISNVTFLSEPIKELENTIYENCNFKEYNFFKAQIKNCFFINCNMEDANFSKATISNCKFINCFMQFCGMVKVNIYSCEFYNCDMWHSNMCHSIIYETLFKKCIIRALFKDLNWQNNEYDNETLIESCGGTTCGLTKKIIKDLISISHRTSAKTAL